MSLNHQRAHVVFLIAAGASLLGLVAAARWSGSNGRAGLPRTCDVKGRSAAPHAGLPVGKPAVPPQPAPTAITAFKDDIREFEGACSYRAQGYKFHADPDGVRAEFPARLPDGDRPRLGMNLEELRVGDVVVARGGPAAPAVRSEEHTVSFGRGAVEERYVLRQADFEQDFVIRELPEGRGEIRVSISARSNLTPPAEGARGKTLKFEGPAGVGLSVANAVALDSAGRKLPLDLEYGHGTISMSVPASWVAQAALPITVDPVIGGVFAIRGPDTNQSFNSFSVAYGSTPNEWMVVWEDSSAFPNEANVFAQRIGADGSLVGSQILVSAASNLDFAPSIAYSPAINRYLIVWHQFVPSTAAKRVVGRFLNADGSPFAPEFEIATISGNIDDAPRLATDGIDTFYVIAWVTETGIGTSIRGFLLSNAGAVIAQPNPRPANGNQPLFPNVAYANQEYMVTWTEAGNPATTMARGMNRAGSFLMGATIIDFIGGGRAWPSTDRFLFTAGGGPQIVGRVALADSSSSITWATNPFAIANAHDTYVTGPGVAFSTTSDAWFVSGAQAAPATQTGDSPNSSLWRNLVSPLGVVSPEEQYVPPEESASAQAVSWNSATNELLTVYVRGSTQAHPGFTLMGVRYALAGSPPNGLAGRWRFDEGSGTLAADSSGSGNDGTLRNGVNWTVGKSGSAVSFDGIDDFISVGATGMPAANAPQSISWWMNYDSVPSGNQCVVGLTNDPVGSAVQCGFRSGQVTVWKFGGGVLAQAPAPSTGVWHHFAYTFDGTTHRLYVDGSLVNMSTAASQTAVPTKVEFGRWSGGSEYYAGKLDEVSIYGQVLTPAQVADLAALDPSVKAYFKFNEGTGTFTADSSGNGHDGTLNSGVSWGSGRSGTAAQFDGALGSISCLLGTGLPANNSPQTISWWMNYPSVGGVQAAICLTNPGAGSAIQAGFRNGGVTIWNWGGNTLVSAPAPSTGAWHHFAYVFDGTTHSLYVDGALANTSTATAQTAAPSRLDFGFTPGWGEFFGGKLDEVRIYDRALGSGEVVAQARVYSLEAYFKFDEGVGPQTADSTGHGHDAVLNSAAWVTGRSATGIGFDGVFNYVTAAVGTGLPANNANQTISWWMNVPANPSGVQTVFDLHNDAAGSSVQGGFRNGNVGIWNHGGNVLAEAAPPAAGSWHHFAYSYDGSTHRLYIDGVVAGSSTAPAQTADVTSFVFGRWNGGPAEYFAGALDEFRVYSRTLSGAEIAALAQDPSLAAHFRFDENGASVAADSTGNGHDGTLSSGASWTSGALGSAVSLDGTGYVACAVRTGLPANNAPQTISWWMNVPANPAGVQTAFDLHNDAAASSIQGGFRNGNVTVWNHGGNVLAQAAPPSAGAWHHFAYTFDGTTHRLYVDAVEANNSTAAPQMAPVSSFVFGRWNGGPAEYFVGSLDDVRIYTRTLSTTEVQGLFQGARPPAPVITSPVSGGTVTQARPPVAGTASAQGLLITLLVDGSPRGTVTSGAGGNWLIYPAAMTDGFHTLTATAASALGASLESAPVTIAVNASSNTQLTVSNATIGDGGFVNSAQPTYSVTLTNQNGNGIDPASIVVHFDGTAVSATVTIVNANTITATFTPSASLTSQSTHVIAIDGLTGIGGVVSTVVTAFTVDLDAPTITSVAPPNGSYVGTRRPTISAIAVDSGGAGFDPAGLGLVVNSVIIPSNQVQVTLAQGGRRATLSYTPASDLIDGAQTVVILARDRAQNAASLGIAFTVDGSGPMIAISSPASGTSVTSSVASLTATIVDLGSGIASVQVTLNGQDVTTTMIQFPGASGTSGSPLGIDLSGILTGLAASNVLSVIATDAAGNTTVSTSIFSFAPQTLLGLEIASGNGQTGLAGRVADNDLVVRVFNRSDNSNVEGVAIRFDPGPGRSDGHAVPGRDHLFITGADGLASCGYVLSRCPGPNTAVATLVPQPSVVGSDSSDADFLNVPPVQFSITGVAPTILYVPYVNLCNSEAVPSTADYPGSAVAQLFDVYVFDHHGSPLKGTPVAPDTTDVNGDPSRIKIGEFFPSRAATGDDGRARFAFVIDLDAPVGSFRYRFRAMEFQSGNNRILAADVGGEVLNPAVRPTPTINFANGFDQSGQSQIGQPGVELQIPLRTVIGGGPEGIVKFQIIAGSGFFGDVTEGTEVNFGQFDGCGLPIKFVEMNHLTGGAAIKFTATQLPTLVAIQGARSDVFAVGPIEARFVSASDPTKEMLFASNLETAEQLNDASFLLEATVPSNFQGTLSASLKVLDEQRRDFKTLDNIGTFQVQNIVFNNVGGNARFSKVRSPDAQPFLCTQTVLGDDLASVPQNTTLLQIGNRGIVRAEFSTPNGLLRTEIEKAEIRLTPIIGQVGVLNAFSTPAPGAKKYKWDIVLPGTQEPVSVTTNGPILVFTLSGRNTDTNHAGDFDDLVNFHFLNVNANRRARGSVILSPLDANGALIGTTRYTDVLLFSTLRPLGRPLPPLETPGLQALPQAQFILGNATQFVPLDSLSAEDKQDVLSAVYPFTSPFSDGIPAYTRALKSPNTAADTFFVVRGDPNAPQAAPTVKTPGVVVYRPVVLQSLDAQDIDATLRHETRHVKHAFSMQGLLLQGMDQADQAFGDLLVRSFQAVHGSPPNPLNTQESLEFGARLLVRQTSEVEATLSSLIASVADGVTSHLYMDSEGDYFKDSYRKIMYYLKYGVFVFEKIPGTTDAVRLKFRIPITGQARRDLVAFMRRAYVAIPRDFRMIRANEVINLSDPDSVLIDDKLQKPQQE